MSLQLGEIVEVPIYQEKGHGKIINVQSIFNNIYYEVFFKKINEHLLVSESDIKPIGNPFTRLIEGNIDSFPFFLLKYLQNDIKMMLTMKGIISAGNFRITPLPHQIIAVDFVLNQPSPRCLIADEVGLGKTIEAAMVFEELKLRGLAKRVLIVTPSGLTQQWREEMKQKFNEDFVIMDRATCQTLRNIHGRDTNIWKKQDLIITSMDFIKPKGLKDSLSERAYRNREEHNRYVFEMVIEAGWDVVVIDEAHKLSKAEDGGETARYKIGKALSELAPVFLLLSATPHQGDAIRFFHLLSLIDNVAFSSIKDVTPAKIKDYLVRNKKRAVVDHNRKRLFKQRLTSIYPIDRSDITDVTEQELYDRVTTYVAKNYNLALRTNDRAFGFLMILFQRLVTSSSRAIFNALQNRWSKLKEIQNYVFESENEEFDELEAIDRDTEEVLQELNDHIGVYSKEGIQEEIFILEGLVDLARQNSFGRQDAKANALLNIINEVTSREENPNTKFLVFTEFISTQKYLEEILSSCGYSVMVLNGQMSTDKKMDARDAFKEQAQFLISTDAGGEGINLQFCHVIINYDLPWNPMKIEQRIGRLDRIGQTHDVLVFNLVLQGTVEERVREIIELKLALIKDQFGDDKLSDILSTLQDDFNFDRIFIDAIAKREKEAYDLEELAQQIYEKAQAILEKNDLLLPQSSEEYIDFQEKLIEVTSDKVKSLVENYLLIYGRSLNEYGKQKNNFYFDIRTDDGVIHYRDVVFDRKLALSNDKYDFFNINHPFVKNILEKDYKDGAVGQLRIHTNEPHLLEKKGVWAIYKLYITNNIDFIKEVPISIFVDEFGIFDRIISEQLLEKSPTSISSFALSTEYFDQERIKENVKLEAQSLGGDLFSKELLDWQGLIAKEREKLTNYFSTQEKILQKIVITNIQGSKLKELNNIKSIRFKNLDRRARLVPKIELEQLAIVIFG